MGRSLRTVFFLLLLGGAAYYYRDHVRTFALQAYREVAPCTIPITYSIEAIDERFGISTTSLEASLAAAARIWQDGAGTSLFTYVQDGGNLKVRLKYDTRQETTERLKDLGVGVEDTLASYEAVRATYASTYASYSTAKRAFDLRYAAYEREIAAYESDVRRWNERGGAPPAAYAELEARKSALRREEAELRELQREVNGMAADVNTLVSELNRLARELNISVSAYNTVGESTGGEFEEAIYESRPGLETITVYEYDSERSLTRVLAHEFGHALGLEHVDDPEAIMYRLNEGSGLALTADDTAALEMLCKLGS